jgi:hypothetical protein
MERGTTNMTKTNNPFIIQIYLDNGVVFEYSVNSASKAREHSYAIIQTGYRHVEAGMLEHYPPHRIQKIKVVGDIDTSFPDRTRGT